jgi:hypothetical protein
MVFRNLIVVDVENKPPDDSSTDDLSSSNASSSKKASIKTYSDLEKFIVKRLSTIKSLSGMKRSVLVEITKEVIRACIDWRKLP